MDRLLLLLLLSLWLLAGSVSPQDSGACPARLLAEERKRACPRPCKSDQDCAAKRQCLCDGQCGLSCVAPGRSCPYPLPPSSSWESRLLSPGPFFSALLEVRCLPGFTLPSGLDVAIRRCQGDRRWSGDEPVCTRVPACPLPPEVTSAFSIQGSPEVGGSIHYSCLSGAAVAGISENFCEENQTWRYPHPECAIVPCRAPREVVNGRVVAVQRTEYEPGFSIHYLCKRDFSMDGPKKITCLPNGNWSAAPPFCRGRCLIPPLRSRLVYDGEKLWPFEIPDPTVPHGATVTFFCKHRDLPCNYPASQTCFDGKLEPPKCYLDPTWLQFKLFPHRTVSEIRECLPSEVAAMSESRF